MTDRNPRDSSPDRPRSEPEIIPPGQRDRRDPSHVFISIDENGGTRRVYLAQPGWGFLLFPTLLGALIVVAVALVYNNLTRDARYPKYW